MTRNINSEQLLEAYHDYSIINHFNEGITSNKTSKRLFAQFSKDINDAFSARGGNILLYNKNNKMLQSQIVLEQNAIIGEIEKLIKIKIPALDIAVNENSVYFNVLNNRRPLEITDPFTITKLLEEYLMIIPEGKNRRRIGKFIPNILNIININTVIIIPLIYKKEILGILEVSRDKQFSENEKNRLVVLANHLTSMIGHEIIEQQFEEISTRYNQAFDNAPIGITLASLDGKFIDVNWVFEKIVGYSKAELLNLDFQTITHPDDLDADLRFVKELLSGEIESFRMEKRYIHKDGYPVPVVLDVSLVRDNSSKPKYTIAHIQDKTAEKNLIALINRLEKFFANSKDEVYILNVDDLKIIDANASAQNNTGYSLKEIREMTLLSLTKNYSSRQFLEILEPLKNGRRVIIEFSNSITRKNGTQYPIHANVHIQTSDSIPVYIVIVEDVEELNRSKDLIQTLYRVGTDIGEANSLDEIFKRFAEELANININVMLFEYDKDRNRLLSKYINFSKLKLEKINKLIGFSSLDYSFEVNNSLAFKKTIEDKKAILLKDLVPTQKTVVPHVPQRVWNQINNLSNIKNAVLSPIISESKILGVLIFIAKKLEESDIPAINVFTQQLSNAWRKIRLISFQRSTIDGIINTIAATVDVRDPYTAGHQERVSDLASAIAVELGMSKQQIEGIRIAGRIHDLGKIKVPAEILTNPGKLSSLEYEMIKAHPKVGYELLKDIEFPWPIAEIIYQHHEKIDGSGYPQGLKGEEILPEARILAVADVVEAMASHRPYRAALGIDAALKYIKKESGKLFCPNCVSACIKIFKRGYKFPEI